MAHEHVGLDAPLPPQRRHRVLDGEERGLGVLGLVEPPAFAGQGMEERPQRHAEQRVEHGRAAIQRLAEHGLRLVELPAHAGVLRSLPREEERHARRARVLMVLDAPGGRGALSGRREGRELGAQILVALGHERRADVELGAGGDGRAHLVQRRVEVIVEPEGQAPREHPQRRLGLRRQAERVARPRGGGAPHRGQRRFLDDEVGVGAAQPERAHPGDAPPRPARPRRALPGDLDGHPLPGDGAAGRLEVQVRRDLLVLEGEDDLDQAGDARGRLEMSEVALHRADEHLAPVGADRAEHAGERGHLDRIAQRRAGAVRLDVAQVVGAHAGALERGADHRLLGLGAGRGEPVALAVLVHRRAADDREHRVAVGERVREPLEDHHRAALAPHVAVRAIVERPALPAGRQRAEGGETDGPVRLEDQVDAPREGGVDVARAERLAGEVHRHQRGRAGGVDRHARPLQAEDVRDPPGGDGGGRAGGQVGIASRAPSPARRASRS